MIHSVNFTLVIRSQLINDFTYISEKRELTTEELEQRIRFNYRYFAGLDVTSVQINSVRIYQGGNNG